MVFQLAGGGSHRYCFLPQICGFSLALSLVSSFILCSAYTRMEMHCGHPFTGPFYIVIYSLPTILAELGILFSTAEAFGAVQDLHGLRLNLNLTNDKPLISRCCGICDEWLTYSDSCSPGLWKLGSSYTCLALNSQ